MPIYRHRHLALLFASSLLDYHLDFHIKIVHNGHHRLVRDVAIQLTSIMIKVEVAILGFHLVPHSCIKLSTKIVVEEQ